MEELLCDLGIENRSDYRKWALKNHPDKNGDVQQFKIVTEAVTSMLPTNEGKIDCDNKPNSPANRGVAPVSSPKMAACIRNMENWTKIMRHHRFDRPGFKPEKMRADIRVMSPKMKELIDRIRRLDAADLASGRGLHKHFIFSDIKAGGHGAKIIASSLVAHGFNSCFDTKGRIVSPKPHKDKETFGLLSSTSVFSKSFTKTMVQTVLQAYNERPGNVHGETMRFVVLDSGFKEGVDLFDVKYVHIFERQRTEADMIQAVGRATRSCGQKGLKFVPNQGWKLHVYMYHSVDLEKIPVFDRYLALSGVDLNKVEFAKNLERMAVFAAVDHDLNEEIHKFTKESSVTSKAPLSIEGGSTSQLGCRRGKCGKRVTKSIPFTLSLMRSVYLKMSAKGLPTNFKNLSTKDKRLFFCELLKTNKAYCEAVNKAYSPMRKFDVDERIQDVIDMREEMRLAVRSASPQSEDVREMSFEQHRKYVNRVFAKYKYPKLQVRNGCEDPVNSEDRVVKFTESQEFISRYFTPRSHNKGLLVWHSVGTGKTCTAIALKSLTFEKDNYWVIWVTRTTLREDIWKNMYDKICDHKLRELAKEGADRNTLKRNVYERFLPPMSYRQFSNLIEGKNDLSRRLINENGRERILNNCLVIVDEAHKLYSKDLVGHERPNMEVIERAIEASPNCKLVLMTGTPIADDPMEFLKLMNLILPANDRFPTDFRNFHKRFLRNNEFTKDGKEVFLDRTKGLISYLNRRFDPRQFAQPVFYDVPVPISVLDDGSLRKCESEVQKREAACKSSIPLEQIRRSLQSSQEDLTEAIRERDLANERIKRDKRDPQSKARLLEARNLVKELMNTVKATKADEKSLTKQSRTCEKIAKRESKRCSQTQKESSEFYQETRLNAC